MIAAATELEVPTDLSAMVSLVRSLLEDPVGHPWTMQDVGLMGLRLGEGREHRLHVWVPAAAVGDPPIHDHPFDFTSTVIAGAITDTRFEESPTGVEHQRDRYSLADEHRRVTDTVRLVGVSTRFTAGQRYHQVAPELHRSDQIPGTVTLVRRAFTPVDVLTVCQAPGSPWITGRSRPASPHEVRRITADALAIMG